MGKKSWVEFDNNESIYQDKPKEDNLRKISKLKILKQKKVKKERLLP